MLALRRYTLDAHGNGTVKPTGGLYWTARAAQRHADRLHAPRLGVRYIVRRFRLVGGEFALKIVAYHGALCLQ